jgi:hypothetical protein
MDDGGLRDYKEEVNRLMDEFREKVGDGTKSGDKFMTLTEIERLWGDLKHGTSEVYTDMVMEALHSANDGDLVRKKKQNTGKKG